MASNRTDIGWIDFSNTDRNKSLEVLSLLSEAGTLDELGIAPIRDGFADLFFPGTSTIQTRAKYFLIVPYACKDMERSKHMSVTEMAEDLYAEEKKCCSILTAEADKDGSTGVIGSETIRRRTRWLKRTPSSIYWAGLRRYGILCENVTQAEYLTLVSEQKKRRKVIGSMASRAESGADPDDADAGSYGIHTFFHLPDYQPDWQNHLTIALTKKEGGFLKNQIQRTCRGSLMAAFLEDREFQAHVEGLDSFQKIRDFVPPAILPAYNLALNFSGFNYCLRVYYNVIVWQGKREYVNEKERETKPQLSAIAEKLNLDAVFKTLSLETRSAKPLYRFLSRSREAMLQNDTERLKALITERERYLKGSSRARCCHPGEVDLYSVDWFCGEELSYRYPYARRILMDIFESQVNNA